MDFMCTYRQKIIRRIGRHNQPINNVLKSAIVDNFRWSCIVIIENDANYKKMLHTMATIKLSWNF